MNFVKMQGTGNDFVLTRPEVEKDWPRLAQAICDRHYGVGADGLILVLPSQAADFQMRIFNPDGSEAEMCGNGIRCFAKYVVEEGLAPPRAELSVEPLAGVRPLTLESDGPTVSRVRVGMGQPRFRPEEIPMRVGEGVLDIIIDYPIVVNGQELKITALSMGNPHAVHFMGTPVAKFPLEEVGPKVERHPAFPRRVNFEVARVLDRGRIEARVWERGAGPTLACGTGACAVAVAARQHDLVDDEVDIMVPGGELHISWDGRGEVYLTGPAETVFRGEWDTDRQNAD